MKKFSTLLCALLLYSSYVVAEAENKEKSSGPMADKDDTWKYLIRIGKLERQFSTSGDNQYGEWAGLVSVGKDLNTFWLTAKGSTQHGDADSAEIRLFYSRTSAFSLAGGVISSQNLS